MEYPTVVLQFEIGGDVERQIVQVMVDTLLDAVTLNASNPEALAWIEEQAQEAYARAYNLRMEMRFKEMPLVEKNVSPEARIFF